MLLFADGFDHYGTGSVGRANMRLGAYASVSGTPDTANKRTGTHGFSCGAPAGARVVLGGPRTTVGVGMGVYLSAVPSSSSIVGLSLRDQSNNDIVSWTVSTDGAVMARKGGYTGTVVAISDSILTAGTFHHIECKWVIDPVVGSVEVRVNGVLMVKMENLNFGAIPAASIEFGQNSTPNGINMVIDDLVIWDITGDHCNDFIGPQRVITIFPTGDTAQKDWTPVGAVNGFDAIDDLIQDGDATHIGATLAGSISEFTLPSLPPETRAVAGVFIPAMARLDEAGIGTLKVSMISGAAVAEGPEIPLTPGYAYTRAAFPIDPATGQAWTKGTVEAAKIRIEKTK